MFDKNLKKEKKEKTVETVENVENVENEENENHEEIKEEECMNTDNLKEQSGIWGRNLNATFDSYDQDWRHIRQYNSSKGFADNIDYFETSAEGLLLYGGIGTGKTFTACCIGNALLEKGHSVYYTNAEDFVNRVKSYSKKCYNSYNNYDGDDEDPMKIIETTDLLIFDDFNTNECTDYALEILYAAINKRYTVGKPMIIATNMTAKQMKNAVSLKERGIFDRIFERCYPVQFNGPSMRKPCVEDSVWTPFLSVVEDDDEDDDEELG